MLSIEITPFLFVLQKPISLCSVTYIHIYVRYTVGFLARNFGSQRKDKLTKLQDLSALVEKATAEKLFSVPNEEVLRTVD